MKRLFRRLFPVALVATVVVLLIPQLVVQANPPDQGVPPQVPHPKEGHTDCLSCHEKGVNGAPKFPPDHTGRTNEMCVICHIFKASAPAGTTAAPTGSTSSASSASASASPTLSSSSSSSTSSAAPAPTTPTPTSGSSSSTSSASSSATPPPPTGGGAPNIPHTLEGRDQCLSCHQTGVGGAPKVPTNHAGRTNDMCRTCHQPKAVVPVVVPTRVPHAPSAANENSCIDCHKSLGGTSADIVQQHSASIHADRGVQCVDCHGGDASKKTKEEAMSPKAGFVGKPKTQDVPALCGSCHARVDLMRQYDLPTDQFAQYQESIHGQKLAQGDTNVATCFVCHDGHGTKQVNDPSAKVYAQNVPALCGSCHSNSQLMKPYGIPTNQYELYKTSVHGIALLQKQDPRAPSCATCHGTHGAAPPGFSEVANVCGSCHSATQEYYLKSQHASNAPGTPKCVTCHGRYDVGPASEAMFVGTGARQCGSCHPSGSPQATGVTQIADAITSSAQMYDFATGAIKRAAGTGLIVAPEEAKLTDAKTNLITARAAQHTLNIDTVKAKTQKATDISREVQADAEKAISDSVFRRQAMVVGLLVAALAIGCLYLIRRELYAGLPPKQ